MLKIEATDRITPLEVLCHQFITKQPSVYTPSPQHFRNKFFKSESIEVMPKSVPPYVILVQPATLEDKLQLEDEERKQR